MEEGKSVADEGAVELLLPKLFISGMEVGLIPSVIYGFARLERNLKTGLFLLANFRQPYKRPIDSFPTQL